MAAVAIVKLEKKLMLFLHFGPNVIKCGRNVATLNNNSTSIKKRMVESNMAAAAILDLEKLIPLFYQVLNLS